MSWQEELRKLDEALASGQLSADDYRIRRDQVLSSAVADTPDASAPHPQAASEQEQPPQQGPSQSGDKTPDSTQVMTPVSPPQGMQQSSPQQPDSSFSGSSAEHTQHMQPAWQAQPPQPGTQQPGGFPPPSPPPGSPHPVPHPGTPAGPQPGQSWNAPEPDASPPWGGSEFPPISPGSSEWTGQGPEDLDKPSGSGKGGKIALVAAVLLLVLGGAGTAIFFATQSDDDPEQNQLAVESSTAGSPPPTTVPSDPYEALLLQIPELQGTPDNNSGVLLVDELVDLDILDADEAELLGAESAEKVAWRGAQRTPDANGPGNEDISVLVIPLDDAEAASDLATQLREYTEDQDFVLIEDALPDIPANVVFHKDVESPIVYRGTWVSDENVIRVNVTQGSEGDEAALSGAYQATVKSLLQPFPPVE